MRKILLTALLTVSMATMAQLKLNFSADSPLRKLQIAEMAIESLYVDSLDANNIVEEGIKGMLSRLDPHSSYSSAKETKELTEPLEGNFDGIGVQFNMIEDTLLVIQTISGGPSAKVGILAGDRIVAVNDTAIAGVKMSRTDIMKRLRGKKGTKVTVSVKRPGERSLLTFRITRDKIPLNSVDAAYIIEPGIGYVKLQKFSATTHAEVVAAIDSLKAVSESLAPDKEFSLILDLQDNGGGYLSAAERVADEFLNEDALIVYTTGRAVPRHESRATGHGRMRRGNIVLLVNEYSASASEIVSGAVQDQDRGVVVGRRTFGKGLVQRPIELPDGSMIRLTVAHYYTPTGRCIQKPFKPGDKKDYDMDINERLKKGELTCRDSIHFADSLKYETLNDHRTVYGGGGIMPDIFVPLDTMKYTRYHSKLVAKGIIVTKILKYFDKNRKTLMQYPDVAEFKKSYETPMSLLDEIVKEGEKEGVTPKDEEEKQRALPEMARQIKALIARDIFTQSAYYEVINDSNDIYNEGVRIIREMNTTGKKVREMTQ